MHSIFCFPSKRAVSHLVVESYLIFTGELYAVSGFDTGNLRQRQ